MTEVTPANPWTLPEPSPAAHLAAERIRQRFRDPAPARLTRATSRLLAALCAGAVLGSGVTALAALGVRGTTPTPAEIARIAAPEPSRRGPALDREWRSYRTPVDVDRMFRTAR